MRLPGELNLNFTNEVNLTIEAENWSSTLHYQNCYCCSKKIQFTKLFNDS